MDCRNGEAFDSKAADRAWFEIYEFVGKYVEDADLQPSVAQHNSTIGKASLHFASIADAMRKVNGTTGVRTAVARSLNEGPRNERDWKLLRERSLVLADCGDWLTTQTPRKGSAANWRRHAASYRDAAQALAEATELSHRTDAEAALSRLNSSCSSMSRGPSLACRGVEFGRKGCAPVCGRRGSGSSVIQMPKQKIDLSVRT